LSLLNLPLHQAPLAFIDTETTGLRPELGHRLVEIAVLRTMGLEKVEQFSSLLNPQRSLDPEAMAVNGITPTMVANAPTFAEVLPKLQPLLHETILVAHNAPFDLGFLETEYKIARATFASGPVLDTLMLARRQYYFHSNSLGNIARKLNIRTPNAHRAMGDVLTTFSVFRRFSGDLIRNNRPLVSDWLRMQGGVVWPPRATMPDLEPTHPIQIALDEHRKLQIQYQDGQGNVTERVIEPLTYSGGYLVAFCHLRHGQRTFRLDKILTVELLNL